MGDYRKLEVWKRACAVSDRVEAMLPTLPRRVQLGLGDQASRSADSIHLNIAEGCGLNSDPQLIKHVRTALGSVNELENAVKRMHARKLVRPEFQDLLTDIPTLRNKLGAFLRTLLGGKDS